MADIPEAAELLRAVEAEPLSHLLAAVRHETSPPGITHISGLDAHLSSTAAHHASLHSSLNRGDVLEIQGPASSGKTHFIYHLTSICLLPDHLDGHRLGGWNKAAVVFDCDDAFDVTRLTQLLDSRISRLLARSSAAGASGTGAVRVDEQREKLLADCLQHLHVFRPTSTLQLAATLLNLPSYHLKNDPDLEIGLLAIDSISAFYWPDRFTVEQLCLGENIPTKDLGNLNPLHHVLKALQRFRLSHGVITVLTNWALNPLTTAFYRQHLHPFPAPFMTAGAAPRQSFISELSSAHIATPTPDDHIYPPITQHVTLSLAPIAPFSPATTVAQAIEQKREWQRQAVERGEVVGLIRTPGSQQVGRFTWRIGAAEIILDSSA